MSLLPYIDSSNRLVDGKYFRLLPFCKKKCLGEKCKLYYEKLKNAESGGYCCPYGLSSYVYISSEGKIIFTGLRNDVPKLINCFDSFVLPSRYEGFGIVYLEAQINQLNCFATEERVPKQVKISSNMHFISEKLNAKEWASIIVKESLERENINKINFREFDIKEQAKKLEKIYMKL